MNPEWLAYFKDLIEGRPVKPWHVWWREHSAEIEPSLGRMAYLKLRFEGLKYAASLLSKADVSFEWSAQGLRAVSYGRLDPSCLDDSTGRPRPEFRERDGGYIQAFCEGDPKRGGELIRRQLSRIRRMRDEAQRSEDLGDLEFDAEAILDEGYVDAAVAMLTAIARWKPLSCLEDAPVQYASKALRTLGISS